MNCVSTKFAGEVYPQFYMLNSKLSSKCAESGYRSSSIKERNLTIGGFSVDFTNFSVPFTSTVFSTVFSTMLIAANE